MPYWTDTICPKIKEGKKVLVVAHGNCLRALVKNFSGMTEGELIANKIPTGTPFMYEFDDTMHPTHQSPRFLVD
jgi:2,3-bisphosphoglycerate-dependent phosphoglycerate mutase